LLRDMCNTSMAIEAISNTCFSPFLLGKPENEKTSEHYQNE